MNRRITYNMVKSWLEESEFFKEKEMRLCADASGYRIVYTGNTVIYGDTPKDVWEKYNILKMGYYMRREV